MKILTILNTLILLIVFFKLKIINIKVSKEQTFWNQHLIAYNIWIQKFHFRIPIRNKRKIELKEEVYRMINNYNHKFRVQTLSAKFSWLKTCEEVKQFEKDYSIVDKEFVQTLVQNFVPKNCHCGKKPVEEYYPSCSLKCALGL